MENEIDFLLSLFTETDNMEPIPPSVLEREKNWASGWLFSGDPINQKLLTSPEVASDTKRLIITAQLERLKDNRLFWETLVQYKDDRNEIASQQTEGATTRINTIENSTLNVGKSAHIGNKNNVKVNIHLNEEKKPEIRCPHCNALAPVDLIEGQQNEEASFGINCPSCKNRYYPISNLAGNVSLYKSLSPRDSETFNHLVNAIESDLKLGNAQKAYERCERLKEQYGKEGALYEYCALTYFYATPIDHIIHNSARLIFVYLEDAKQRNPNSETYSYIAGTIALGYAQRVRSYLDYERSKIPVKRKPSVAKPGKAELDSIEKDYRHAVTLWRSRLLRTLDEYETAYRIFPMDDFLKAGVMELCGHNGTPWFNLRFEAIFLPPANQDIIGFVWDYYRLKSNMKNFDGKTNNRPEELLSNWYQQTRKNQQDYALPDILIGEETSIGAFTIKSRLIRNAWIFWGAFFALFLLGFLIGNTYTVLFSVILLALGVFKFREVKESIMGLVHNL
ncbi:MAG TPA: hypothetical protein PLO67_05205 [Saprospiraceae bacterium]|nr:hypothetical protein [Saprospiraceae bacterium]